MTWLGLPPLYWLILLIFIGVVIKSESDAAWVVGGLFHTFDAMVTGTVHFLSDLRHSRA